MHVLIHTRHFPSNAKSYAHLAAPSRGLDGERIRSNVWVLTHMLLNREGEKNDGALSSQKYTDAYVHSCLVSGIHIYMEPFMELHVPHRSTSMETRAH